jgi:hypothetical protein
MRATLVFVTFKIKKVKEGGDENDQANSRKNRGSY